MKTRISGIAAVFMLAASLAFAADYAKAIVGKWGFEFKGQSAATEYRPDGTFTQIMGDTKVDGKYAVRGNILNLDVGGKKTPWTIQSFDGKRMSMKRERDGRVIIYNNK